MLALENILKWFSCGLVASQLAHAAPGTSATIYLDHNDQLQGEVLSFDDSQSLQFLSPLFDEPLQILPRSFHSILFAAKEQKTETIRHRVTLINGDRLHGKINSIDKQFVTLATPHTKLLKIKRSDISNITLRPEKQTLFQGPTEDSDWHSLTHWDFEAKALYATQDAKLALKLPLHEQFDFTMDFSWDRRPPIMIVTLASPSPTRKGTDSNFYTVHVSSSRIQIHRFYSDQPNRLLDSFPVPETKQNKRALSVYRHRQSNTLKITVDGVHCTTIIDPDSDQVKGHFITVQSQVVNSAHPVHIKRLALFSDTNRKQHEDLISSNHDLILSEENEIIHANITSVSENGRLLRYRKFDDASAQSIAMNNVQSILFKQNNDALESQSKYRIYLRGTGQLSCEKLQSKDQHYTIEHPLLGQLMIATSEIQSITALHNDE